MIVDVKSPDDLDLCVLPLEIFPRDLDDALTFIKN